MSFEGFMGMEPVNSNWVCAVKMVVDCNEGYKNSKLTPEASDAAQESVKVFV